jgi:hypothetical protein
MKREEFNDFGADRYKYDFNTCSVKKGFAQVDTGQDASYFGTWANPERLMVVCYCEGDVTIEKYESESEFVEGIRALVKWNEESGHGFKGIDPGFSASIKEGFQKLGLGDLLH